MANISTYLLPAVAAQLGRVSLSSTTKPTQTQVLGWMDRCLWDLIIHCLPRKVEAGVMTPGRLDLINKITQKGVADAPGSGTFTQPSLALAYLSILCGKYVDPNTTYYESRETTYGDLLDASLNAIYTPGETEPVYAWADGVLYYLPTTLNRADFHYIEMPAVLTSSSAWPINDSLMPCALDYVLMEMWKQRGEYGKANAYQSIYQNAVAHLTGESYNIIESWSR